MAKLVYLLVALCLTTVTGDFDCVCNYSVEKAVHASPSDTSATLGYLYEFDCKATVHVPGLGSAYKGIAFNHQLGYVQLDDEMDAQICPGDISPSDILTTTNKPNKKPITTTTTTTITTTPTTTTTMTTTPTPTTATISTTMTTTPTTTTIMSSKGTQHTNRGSHHTPPVQSTTVPTSTPTTTTTTPISEAPSSTQKPITTTTTTTTTTPATTIQPTTPAPKTTTTTMTTPPTITSTTQATTTSTRPTTTSPTTTTSTTPAPTTSTTTTSTTAAPTTTTTTRRTTTSTPAATTTTTTAGTTRPVTAAPHNIYITGSPLAYIGVGYNVLTGNPSGHDRSDGGGDPGLLVHKRIFELTPKMNGSDLEAKEADITISKHCTSTTSSIFVHDGKSYQNEMMRYVDLQKNGGTSSAVVKSAFMLNQDFQQVRQQTEGSSHVVYHDVTSTCSLDSARYKDDQAGGAHFMVSREFARDVCKLPLAYNDVTYQKFVSTWGTSIVMAVKTGILSVKRYKTSGQQVLSNLDAQGKKIFYLEGHYGSYPTSVAINSTKLSQTTMTPFGAQIDSRVLGTRYMQVPVHVSLAPLTNALDTKYWTQILSRSLYADICSGFDGAAALTDIVNNLRRALETYTSSKMAGVSGLHDIPITIPMTWPHGTYGLMQATTGCPGSQVHWGDGYRKYDTEDSGSNNYFSANIQHYLAGSFASNNLVTRFCMKTTAAVDSYDRGWPAGTYCLLKKGGCPSGFGTGYIYWDDEDLSNSNSAGGALPDGSYTSNTKIYYCCRQDGQVSHPILLPRDRPFVLVRYGASCQAVYGMTVQNVFIRWDDDDIFNSDSSGGAHPFDDGGSKDHRLHFCHYQASQTGIAPGIIG